MRWRDRKRCPHIHLRGIYGDEIIRSGYRRNHCLDCGRLLDGPVLVSVIRSNEATVIDARRATHSTEPVCVAHGEPNCTADICESHSSEPESR